MKKQIRLTVDAVVIRNGKILLVKRLWEPFRSCWALPGGFVEYGETTEDACIRELVEETSVKGKIGGLIGVYSDPKRDPRGHTITVAYLVSWILGEGKPSEETKEVKWFSIKRLPEIAFDHADIIKDALSAIRQKSGKGNT
jgi:8-oxo-dGTP diphosphatase